MHTKFRSLDHSNDQLTISDYLEQYSKNKKFLEHKAHLPKRENLAISTEINPFCHLKSKALIHLKDNKLSPRKESPNKTSCHYRNAFSDIKPFSIQYEKNSTIYNSSKKSHNREDIFNKFSFFPSSLMIKDNPDITNLTGINLTYSSDIFGRTKKNFQISIFPKSRNKKFTPIINSDIINNSNIHNHLNFRDIFNKKEYKKLQFNINQINSQKEYYKIFANTAYKNLYRTVKNQNNSIENNDNNDNNNIMKTHLQKSFTEKESLYNLSLSSITIRFIKLNDNSLHYEYKLPFHFIPLFYYRDFNYFKILLTKMICFKENTFTTIKVNLNKLYPFFRRPKPTSTNSIIFPKVNAHRPSLKSSKKLRKYSTSQLGNSESEKEEDEEKTIRNIFSTISNIIYFEEDDIEILAKKGNYIEPDKANIQLKYSDNKNGNYFNIYEFVWITPKISYKVEIDMPLCILENKKNNVIIKKYVDFTLLFFLYENQFENWDYYLINDLLSYKLCRHIIDKLSSQYNDLFNQTFDLSFVKKYTYSELDTKINYIVTNDDFANCIGEITSFQMIINKSLLFNEFKEEDNDNSSNQEYIINFNLSQLRKIFIVSNLYSKEKLKDVLIKFLNIDKGTKKVSFEYEKFDSINDNDWEKLFTEIIKFSYGESIQEENRKFKFSRYASSKFHYTKKNVLRNNVKKVTIRKVYHTRTYVDLVYPFSKIFNIQVNGDVTQISKKKIYGKFKTFAKTSIMNLPGLIISYQNFKCQEDKNNNDKIRNTNYQKGAFVKMNFNKRSFVKNKTVKVINFKGFKEQLMLKAKKFHN